MKAEHKPTKAQKKARTIILVRAIADKLNIAAAEIGNNDIFNLLQTESNKLNLVINNICEL